MGFSLRRKSQRIKTVETSRRRSFVPMTSHIHLLSCRLKELQPGQYHCQLKRHGRPTRQLKSAKEREGNTRFIWGEHQRGKNWIGHILRGESLLREVIESRMIGKRPRGSKRLGMLNEFLKESSYAELKGKEENRKEWRIWKPRTCLTAEH